MKSRRLPVLLALALPAMILTPEAAAVPQVNAQSNPAPGSPGVIPLTEAEKSWIAHHPVVRIQMSDSSPPFEFREDGRWQGMGYDYITAVCRRLGVELRVTDLTWSQALERIQEKRDVDLLLAVTRSLEREKIVHLSRAYLVFPQVIFTRKHGGFVAAVHDLAESAVAVEKDYVTEAWLRRDIPRAKLIVTKDTATALEAVATGRADAYVGNLAVASYLIDKKGFINLTVAAPTVYGDDALAMGVRKDWPELARLIDKALGAITEEEHRAIRQKWLSVRYEYGWRTLDVLKWVLIVAGVALVFIVQLRAMVKRRTTELQREVDLRRVQEEAVRESEERFRVLVEQAPEAIVVYDVDQERFVNANKNAERLFGCGREELLASGPERFYTPRQPDGRPITESVREYRERALAGETVVLERAVCSGEGKELFVEVRLSRLPSADRRLIRASLIDITERKRAEEALAERTRQLEAVRVVGQEITREMRLPALLELIVERAAGLVGAAGGSVMLWDEAGSVLVPGVWIGRAPETRASQIALGEGVTGTVAAQRKGMIVNDYRNSPLARPAMLERTKITATIAEPLLYQDRLVGVINLDNGETNRRFTEQDQEILRLFGAQAVIAVQNAQFYANAERDRRESEILAGLARKLNASLDLDAVLQEVAGGARELCESDFVELAMREPGQETLRLRCVAGRRLEDHPPLIVEPGKGMGGAILATGQPFRTGNYAEDPRLGKEHLARAQALGVTAEIGVPILIDGRIEGIIYADNCRPRPFNDRDEATLIRLAEQAAVAIRNARLYEATQRELADRLRAEAALRQSETHYRTLFESAQDAIFLMQGERFVDCNPPTLRMFGCRREQILGETPWRFSPVLQPDGRDSAGKASEKIQAAISGVAQRFEWRHCQLDGTAFDAEVSLNRVQFDGQSLLLAIVRDITGRKQAEQRLQKSREQLRALSSRLQSLREEERTRIARQIHDHLGQLLTALKLDLRTLQRRVSAASETELRTALNNKIISATELADETITSVQKIASELRPGVLDRLGLAAAIEVEAQTFQTRTGMQCEWSLPNDPVAIPEGHATAVFRIFQEVLTNVARHARATRVTVRLSYEGDSLILQVQDDGVGILESDIENPKSLGLLGMQERAAMCGGKTTFRGSAGQGTTVTVQIPLEGKAGQSQ